MTCCTGGRCCGPGSYCCAHTGPHGHPELDDVREDPLPWFERPLDVRHSIGGWGFVFDPRPGYEQDRARYGADTEETR